MRSSILNIVQKDVLDALKEELISNFGKDKKVEKALEKDVNAVFKNMEYKHLLSMVGQGVMKVVMELQEYKKKMEKADGHKE